jgi:hypothetical protein
MRVSRLVMPAVLALGALGVTSGPAVAADPDPDVRSYPGGMTCVGSTVAGVARISSTRFTSGRIELRYNSGGKVFQKVIGGKDLIVKKGIFDYPFSFDISSAPAGTSQYLGYATAGEPPAVDSVQSKVLAAADCAPVDADKTAPTTEISLPSSATGWYADSVPVTLAATDTGSGVAKTYYRVDDGPAKEWTGALSHSVAGAHTISYWSVDVAGKLESAKTREVKVDTATPTIAGTVTPAANDLGWHNTAVDVSFTCTDADSGVPTGGCTPGTPVLNGGADQSVHGAATDNVGKTASVRVDGINIDKTRPTLTAVRKTPPNAAGWNNGNVTVGWSATDPLSGIDPVSQPSDGVVTGEGSDLGATASVRDRAGNTGTGSINGIKIDRTRPTVSGAIVTDDGSARRANAAGWF